MAQQATHIDSEIAALKEKLALLETKKAEEAKRLEGLSKLDQAVAEFERQYGLDDGALFEARAEQLVAWVKAQGKRAERPAAFEQLRDYFANVIRNEGKKDKPAPRKRSRRGEAVLAVGSYRNPATGELVEKIKRNPKTLDVWVAEHGLDVVRGWKQ